MNGYAPMEHLALHGVTAFDGADGRACPEAAPVDAEFVVRRLEEAGRTLLALPGTGYSTRLRVSQLDVAGEVGAAMGELAGRIRASAPSAACITRMDEALGWLPMIPHDRYVLRRIVDARSLVSPTTERHLFSWRKLGCVIGADHKAVQKWHGQGIGFLVAALRGRRLTPAG